MGIVSSKAQAIVAAAFFVNYSFALLGGFLADAFMGNFRVLVLGTSTIILSALVLLNSNLLRPYYGDSLFIPFSIVGIALFVVGNGIAKPSLSSFMGAQFNESESKQRSQWFSWFYLSIQIGALTFSIGTPYALQYLPAWVSFAIILTPSLLGLVCFLIPSGSYKKVTPTGNVFSTFFGIVFLGMSGQRHTSEAHWLDKAKRRYSENEVEDVKKVLRTLVVFVPLPFFWAIFFQMYSVWYGQAKLMNLTVGSFPIPPGETTVLNGLLDIGLIPLFEKVVYPLCAKCFNFTPLKRIAAGHVFTILAMIAAGVVSLWIDQSPPNSVSVFWIYFLISCAEILLSITGLEFAFSEAPASMKGMMTAIFMSTTAFGNVIILVLALMDFKLYLQDFALAGMIFVVLIIFTLIARNYEYSKPADQAIN